MKFSLLTIILFISIYSCKNSNSELESPFEATEISIRNQGVMCAEGVTDFDWYLSESKAPLFDGLDALHYPITAASQEAQAYFDQGLILTYGFNHAEAARSFHQAVRLDPDCAMCYWGFAYVLGPNYNAGMEPDNYERAFDAIQRASSLSVKATTKEKDLIRAMSMRYSEDIPEDRSSLDIAYSKALEEVSIKYPEDATIACLYAESQMNLHPWDLYTHTGEMKPWTPQILSYLERVFKIDPKYPGAHHLYIHAVEASNTPEKGYASAAEFDRGLVPGSGHLVHMPSHIYIRTGDYHRGLEANIRAVAVDSSYVTQCHAQGAYPLGYYPHNIHFIAACGMMAGNSQWAAYGANSLSLHAHRQLMKEDGWGTLQHYYSFPYYTAVKFARWDDILQMENANKDLKYPEAVRHFARGMAFLGKQQTDAATKELASLKLIAQDETLKEVSIWGINSVHTLIEIAWRVLEGELEAKKDNIDVAIHLMDEAIILEDNLQYQEPTDWMLSVRHHKGAILIEHSMPKDAIEVYKRDLMKWPKNGWALKGLSKAYEALGLTEQAEETKDKFTRAWTNADITIESSRIW
jgi:tetratricopeptide (TPR) repeat protein